MLSRLLGNSASYRTTHAWQPVKKLCRMGTCTNAVLSIDTTGIFGISRRCIYMNEQMKQSVYRSPLWEMHRGHFAKVAKAQCQCCGQYAPLHGNGSINAGHLDHKKSLADGGAPHHRTNLQWLCSSCHARKTNAMQYSSLWECLINGIIRRNEKSDKFGQGFNL